MSVFEPTSGIPRSESTTPPHGEKGAFYAVKHQEPVPAGTQSAKAQPSGAEPAKTQPAGPYPSGAEPAETRAAVAEPTGAEPAGATEAAVGWGNYRIQISSLRGQQCPRSAAFRKEPTPPGRVADRAAGSGKCLLLPSAQSPGTLTVGRKRSSKLCGHRLGRYVASACTAGTFLLVHVLRSVFPQAARSG